MHWLHLFCFSPLCVFKCVLNCQRRGIVTFVGLFSSVHSQMIGGVIPRNPPAPSLPTFQPRPNMRSACTCATSKRIAHVSRVQCEPCIVNRVSRVCEPCMYMFCVICALLLQLWAFDTVYCTLCTFLVGECALKDIDAFAAART